MKLIHTEPKRADVAPSRSSAKLLRVAFLGHTSKLSGGELALARLLPALDKSRITPVAILGEEGPLVDLLRDSGIEVVVVPIADEVSNVRKDSLGAKGFSRLKPLLLSCKYASSLKRELIRQRIDIVHTNTLKASFYGLVAAKMAHKTLVWHVRDMIDESYLPGLAVKLVRAFAERGPDLVIVNSQSTLESLKLEGTKQKVVRVHDGLSEDEYLDDPRFSRSHKRTSILMVGRIAWWKGQHVLVEAAELLKSQGLSLQFVIAGEPMFGEKEYFCELRQLVRESGLDDCFHFLGFVRDVKRLMSQADVLVHASISAEPFGQVLVEGMACGLPVIASGAGGPLEIIENGESGLLYTPGSAEELAQSIRTLVEDEAFATRIARNGFQRAKSDFSIQAGADAILDLYSQLPLAVESRMSESEILTHNFQLK